MNGVVTTSCKRDVVVRMYGHVLSVSCVNQVVPCCSHVRRMIKCEPGCGCVNWLVMFEWGHV